MIGESRYNKGIREEAKAFNSQLRSKVDKNKLSLMQVKLLSNMEMVNAKVSDIDQVQGVVDVNPTKKTYMPQMENRKRYIEVQRAVSPIKEKG